MRSTDSTNVYTRMAIFCKVRERERASTPLRISYTDPLMNCLIFLLASQRGRAGKKRGSLKLIHFLSSDYTLTRWWSCLQEHLLAARWWLAALIRRQGKASHFIGFKSKDEKGASEWANAFRDKRWWCDKNIIISIFVISFPVLHSFSHPLSPPAVIVWIRTHERTKVIKNTSMKMSDSCSSCD